MSDNEVDGFSLLHMTEMDIFAMLPGKIGVARKLVTLVKQWQDEQVTFIFNNVSRTVHYLKVYL